MKNPRILVACPHTDDETLGCGGYLHTVLSQLNGGSAMIALFSHGGAGIKWKARQYEAYSNNDRLKEFEAACGTLCVLSENIRYFVDPKTEDTVHHRLDRIARGDLVAFLEQCIVEFKPNLILVPNAGYDQDHEAVNKAVKVIMRPHFYSGSVWEYFVGSETNPCPNKYVMLADESMYAKERAFRCYKTQKTDPIHTLSCEHVRDRARIMGRNCNTPFAEAFVVLRDIQ